jgi:hypothetical protein
VENPDELGEVDDFACVALRELEVTNDLWEELVNAHVRQELTVVRLV